jgi:hypothetical protein
MSLQGFLSGDWNAACFRCGQKRKASELRKEWQGYYVCPEHWEPRHPQDFVKGVPDDSSVPWSQPEEWNYVGPQAPVNTCTIDGRFSVAGLATAGCMVAGTYQNNPTLS